MLTEATPDPKFEIGHILFVDIVGYSKLLIGEQTEVVRQLKQIVAECEQVRFAERQKTLIFLPTGDGMALVFRESAEAPAQCALEIAQALKNHPRLQLRMGIHSGPVNLLTDVNNRANVAGAGVNMAQRVMDCGDAGHILLSKHVAEDLENYGRWRPYLRDLGECEVKHGVRVSLVNFCSDNIGNPKTPEKLRQAKREAAIIARRRRKRTLLITSILVAALFGAGYWVFRRQLEQKRATQSLAIPLKSIAVLPFENLSASAENAFFADGVQDEILTNLARIRELMVISRSSAGAEKATSEHAVDLLDRAVARDPNFFLAYCDLVHAHAELYFYNFDRSPARQALAESALQNAERLRPDAGETHLAKAEYLYRCHLKFDRARAELALAARQLPNSSRVYALSGFIDRREGHWDEAIRNLEKARQLDPQNIIILQQIANCYPYLRRFKEETDVVDRILALTPRDPGIRVTRAFIELERYGK